MDFARAITLNSIARAKTHVPIVATHHSLGYGIYDHFIISDSKCVLIYYERHTITKHSAKRHYFSRAAEL